MAPKTRSMARIEDAAPTLLNAAAAAFTTTAPAQSGVVTLRSGRLRKPTPAAAPPKPQRRSRAEVPEPRWLNRAGGDVELALDVGAPILSTFLS